MRFENNLANENSSLRPDEISALKLSDMGKLEFNWTFRFRSVVSCLQQLQIMSKNYDRV